MTKRWKMVLGALAIALAWAAAAWGDHVRMPDQDPYERAALGAGVGGSMVFVALLPALGAWLLMGVRSGKMPRWRAVLDFVLLLGVEGVIWVVFGDALFSLWEQIFGVQIPSGVQIASAGTAVLAAVALVVGRRTQSRVWLVASAVVAACAIVLLAWGAYRTTIVYRPSRPYHYDEFNNAARFADEIEFDTAAGD